MRDRRIWPVVTLLCGLPILAAAQTPQPFPKPGDPSRPQPSTPPAQQPPPKVLPPQSQSKPQPADGEPTEQTLGMPIYPGSQFITSYDAGRGQRYYLYGTNGGFAEVVAYYRTTLKQRGDLTFETPPIHMFEVGRFREETMAFPPGVTIKDYTWGGSEGFINPKPGTKPTHFRTIIQIVPAPPIAGIGK